MKKIEIIGVMLTIFWVALAIFLIFIKWDNTLTLNEWGDFLAGATAPLAFLWLIVGYMLQRKELQNNTEALLYQRDEMAKQVEALVEQNKHLKVTARAVRAQTSF